MLLGKAVPVPNAIGAIGSACGWAAAMESTLMTSLGQSHSDEQTEARAGWLATCWQVRGPSGNVFECAVYRGDDGLELRVSRDNESVSTAAVASIEEGRARGARLKGMVLESGRFEELVD